MNILSLHCYKSQIFFFLKLLLHILDNYLHILINIFAYKYICLILPLNNIYVYLIIINNSLFFFFS